MAMNFAPLDCSCQGASSEPKKIYYTITENLVRIKKIFGKKPCNLIFTPFIFIKQHMAMNFAPLDCSCQGASSQPKKI
jgi:hypothetical protein